MILDTVITILAILMSTVLAARIFKINYLLSLMVVVSTAFFAHVLLRVFGVIVFTNFSIALVYVAVWVFFWFWRIVQVAKESPKNVS